MLGYLCKARSSLELIREWSKTAKSLIINILFALANVLFLFLSWGAGGKTQKKDVSISRAWPKIKLIGISPLTWKGYASVFVVSMDRSFKRRWSKRNEEARRIILERGELSSGREHLQENYQIILLQDCAQTNQKAARTVWASKGSPVCTWHCACRKNKIFATYSD